jgi:hypothetical protein
MSCRRILSSPLFVLIALAVTLVAIRSVSAQTITFNYTGAIELYTIPTTGTYTLTAAGARGGTNGTTIGGGAGGGAQLQGSILLTTGMVLNIAVGGIGESVAVGGGGGGTFVYTTNGGNTPLLVAGGGGGAGSINPGIGAVPMPVLVALMAAQAALPEWVEPVVVVVVVQIPVVVAAGLAATEPPLSQGLTPALVQVDSRVACQEEAVPPGLEAVVALAAAEVLVIQQGAEEVATAAAEEGV